MPAKKSPVTTPPSSAAATPPPPPADTPKQPAAAQAAAPTPPGAPEAQPARKVRYALVGLGHIAQVAVLPGFAGTQNSELAALVSGDARKLRTLNKKYPAAKAYRYEQFDECL